MDQNAGNAGIAGWNHFCVFSMVFTVLGDSGAHLGATSEHLAPPEVALAAGGGSVEASRPQKSQKITKSSQKSLKITKIHVYFF